jgi:hypothetical protein
MRESIRKAFASSQLAPPSPGGGGSLELGDAKHRPERAGWGDSLSLRTPPKLKDLHPTPSRISLRSMRADPPPPGEGEGVTTPDSRRSPHFRVLAAQCVRGLGYFRPSWNKEGAGKAGCRLHPWVPCNKKHGGRTTGSTGSSGFPCAMVLRFPSCSPRRPALLPPSLRGCSSAKLGASIGAPGPHDFAVRLQPRSSRAAPRPPHPTARS